MIPVCQKCHGNLGWFVASNGDYYASDPEDGQKYKWVRCDSCEGSGKDTEWVTCPDCKGDGECPTSKFGSGDCDVCNGTGQVRKVTK